MSSVVRPWEREAFKRCRRAWDLGATERQNYEPISTPSSPDLGEALRDALAIYYYPGMWEWGRSAERPSRCGSASSAGTSTPGPPGTSTPSSSCCTGSEPDIALLREVRRPVYRGFIPHAQAYERLHGRPRLLAWGLLSTDLTDPPAPDRRVGCAVLGGSRGRVEWQ